MRNPSGLSDPSIDATRRFVRVRHLRDDGFVEFDFAIGDPELYAELILPRPAFEAFARMPGTEVMSERVAREVAQREEAYLYGHHLRTPSDDPNDIPLETARSST